MTVNQKPVNESKEGDNSVSDLRKAKEFFSQKVPLKLCVVEVETDQESIGSSEEMESPRSVTKLGRWTPKKIVCLHSQVLRIREEDSHIGEEVGEGLKDKMCVEDFLIFSRPILPASPLSGKTVH